MYIQIYTYSATLQVKCRLQATMKNLICIYIYINIYKYKYLAGTMPSTSDDEEFGRDNGEGPQQPTRIE
jgi:hypothetical protein